MTLKEIDLLRQHQSTETTEEVQPNFNDVKTVSANISSVTAVALLETSGKLDDVITASSTANAVLNMSIATGAEGSDASWDGMTGTLTIPRGDTGLTGATGDDLTLTSIVNNLDDTLTLNFSDGTSHTTGVLKGVQGDQGIQGIAGIDGTKVTSITSNKVNKTTTVTVNGDFSNAPYQFTIQDGVDGITPIKGVDYFDGTDGIDGKTITSINSSKAGKTTTVTINGTFTGSPHSFNVNDGEDGENGLVDSVVAGTNVLVDNTDPANPIVSLATLTRNISIVAVEKGTAIVDSADIIGAIEIPFVCNIEELRAKTTTGTATVTFKNNGAVVGSVNATTTGVSNTTLSNTSMNKWDDFTMDVSNASGNGLIVTIIVEEV